eukprot:m.532244 g.532244  ORF g.532244 m.532244 type:complete len:177 (-) comp22042_c1_seq4:43-573(-)
MFMPTGQGKTIATKRTWHIKVLCMRNQAHTTWATPLRPTPHTRTHTRTGMCGRINGCVSRGREKLRAPQQVRSCTNKAYRPRTMQRGTPPPQCLHTEANPPLRKITPAHRSTLAPPRTRRQDLLTAREQRGCGNSTGMGTAHSDTVYIECLQQPHSACTLEINMHLTVAVVCGCIR